MFVCLSMIALFLAALAYNGAVGSDHMQSSAVNWSSVEAAMGMRGDVSPDGVIKFEIPRSLIVNVDGVNLASGSDGASEFEFMGSGNRSMMVGEIMLKEDEVTNVTRMLAESGINETALHNHLLRASPHIMWLHVCGEGDPVEMAITIRNITSMLGGAAQARENTIPFTGPEASSLDRIMGVKGEVGDGVYGFSIPRADAITMNGMELAQEMDISSDISFQPLGNGTAAVIGELVLEKSEVGPVMRSLAGNGVEVTALHSHMITEEPRLFYLHCWKVGNATEIAGSLREALDRTNSSVSRASSATF